MARRPKRQSRASEGRQAESVDNRRGGTTEPEMDTLVTCHRQGGSLFGKTRQAVLSLLFRHPDCRFHLREIVRLTGSGQGAVQRELERLARAGLVVRQRRGNMVFCQANRDSPVFAEVRGLIAKTSGVVDILKAALAEIADRIDLAFVFGSLARGGSRPNCRRRSFPDRGPGGTENTCDRWRR